MITLSWGTVVGFVTFTVLIGPGLIYVGRMSRQVETNTHNISKIFSKIDKIHEFVKNGGKR